MINSFVDLMAAFVGSELTSVLLFPIFGLAFLATVPYIFRAFFGR